jgi:hypothetical protein
VKASVSDEAAKTTTVPFDVSPAAHPTLVDPTSNATAARSGFTRRD